MSLNEKKRRRNQKRRRISEKISRAFDVPPDAVSDDSTAEIRGRSEMIFTSCCGIVDYHSRRVIIEAPTAVASVIGDRLSVKSYTDGRIFITGRISCVRFFDTVEEAYDS